MTSFKSKMVNFLVRNRHLLKGKLKKEKFDLNTSIAEFRAQCEKSAARLSKIPEGILIKPATIEKIKAEWLIPENSDSQKLIFYVHGGGYVSGSCSDHRGFISKFARQTGVTNLVYEYRLAPENPFPAALDDSLKAYQEILNLGYKPENIVFAGESAGGGLCLALLLYLRDKNISLPAAAIAISPWLDLTCSSDSYHTKNKRSAAPLDSWMVFSKHYVGANRADNPYISPLFGNLEGLPPILINSGTDDELFDDGEKFFQKARKSGVEIIFREGKGMIHCYPLLAPMFPEATEAMNEIIKFIRHHLKIT